MKRLLLAFLLASCTSGSRSASPDSAQRLRVFYNNDNFAYLETCGCRVSPIGGMDRRWNAMKAYPDDSRIFLDAGNLLFKGTQASEFLAPQWFEQALGVVEAYNLLGADAVALGETELALGVDRFFELAAKAKFPFLSSNVFWKNSGKPFLQSSLILERQGKKIGVFGLFGMGLKLPEQLESKNALDSARAEVAKLKSAGANMVIALTHQGYDADLALARSVPGIDLIIGGHSQSLLQRPYEENNVLIVQLSNEGQMLGMVEYDTANLPKVRTQFVVSELNADFNEAPKGMANPMKSLVAVTNLRIQETNRALDRKIWQEQEKHLGSSGIETFLSCRECHEKQAAFHEGKPHSAAFLTLLAAKKEQNLDCLKCHSVGLGQTGGFEGLSDAFRDALHRPMALEKILRETGKDFPKGGESYRKNPKKLKADISEWHQALKKAGVRKSFVGVQCENCHGPLPGHPFSGLHPTAVRITSCVQCHTKEQAPGWYRKDGNLDEIKAQSALESMKCPR